MKSGAGRGREDVGEEEGGGVRRQIQEENLTSKQGEEEEDGGRGLLTSISRYLLEGKAKAAQRAPF